MLRKVFPSHTHTFPCYCDDFFHFPCCRFVWMCALKCNLFVSFSRRRKIPNRMKLYSAIIFSVVIRKTMAWLDGEMTERMRIKCMWTWRLFNVKSRITNDRNMMQMWRRWELGESHRRILTSTFELPTLSQLLSFFSSFLTAFFWVMETWNLHIDFVLQPTSHHGFHVVSYVIDFIKI